MKNKKITLVIIVLILISINKCIFASFADYTDEDAEKETQNMIQEHKEHFDSSKSDNNFLENLTVSGGTLSPNFDRQILQYSLKIENNIKEINIIANPEDKNATVKGDGKVEVGDTLECKIDVIAESGTTRTYIIKMIKNNEEENNEKSQDENIQDMNELSEDKIENIETTNKNYNNTIENNNTNNIENIKYKKYVLLGICIVILLFALSILHILNNKKSKH